METGTAHEPGVEDDLQGLMAGLRMPSTVAAVTYPRGCRIRRVRVKAPKVTGATGDKRRPVIVSRRALRGSREDASWELTGFGAGPAQNLQHQCGWTCTILEETLTACGASAARLPVMTRR